MTKPALTRQPYGSTRCPGCEKPFRSAPGAVIEIEAQEENVGRVDSVGQRHRGIGTHAVLRRWHRACLDDFETRNAEYRRQAAQDREDMARSIAEAAGLDFDSIVKEMNAG